MELLQRSRQTRFKRTGWFIQDDTGQLRKPTKGARGSDGVACQYIGNVGKVDEGIVFVSTHYVDERKHFPVTSELFWPKAAVRVFEERQAVVTYSGYALNELGRRGGATKRLLAETDLWPKATALTVFRLV